ncbi:hypothetical protein K438DRAFT_1785037 [Mycena galopus ATCC 62051]|nr:hypothetical protein K438DRAFT_1785037 [Mycena galopus ATCC 62051]
MSATGKRVSDLINQIISTSTWCASRHGGGARIDRSTSFDNYSLFGVHQGEDETGKVVIASRHLMLSLLGFLSWLQSVVDLGEILKPIETRWIKSLALGQRGKTGVLYYMKRDYHEANVPHLLAHQVPIHLVFTEEMKKDRRFRRVDLDVWSEFLALGSSGPSIPISLKDLPSYLRWAEDWCRSDWLFQNTSAGKPGRQVTNFQLNWEYLAVEFYLYSYCPLPTVEERQDDVHFLSPASSVRQVFYLPILAESVRTLLGD